MSEAKNPCRRRDDCRLCGSLDMENVLSLTPSPPANAFVQDPDQIQTAFPLDLRLCNNCAHLQLSVVVDPSSMFENYVYVSGTSPSFVRHFKDYAQSVISDFGLASGDLVVDIGSNDGTLLGFFKSSGMNVLGIDPARRIAHSASEAGIDTWSTFFDSNSADRIVDERGSARCVTANNVFAHIDDLSGVVSNIKKTLSNDGVFVFEVSYLVDVLEKTLFDTIYHEHLDYHSISPLVPFFEKHGMELIDARRITTHGGSIRCVVQLQGGPHARTSRVDEILSLETGHNLGSAETYRALGRKIDAVRDELKQLLETLQRDGNRIAGFGAPAKATTLMYHFGLGPDTIEFIVDDSPLKQGLFSPGLHVPVLPASELYQRSPNYVVILAWNFAYPIIKNHSKFLASGGHFIVPLPEMAIH
jgi:SAM-dependent methyltransferase